MYSLSASCLY